MATYDRHKIVVGSKLEVEKKSYLIENMGCDKGA